MVELVKEAKEKGSTRFQINLPEPKMAEEAFGEDPRKCCSAQKAAMKFLYQVCIPNIGMSQGAKGKTWIVGNCLWEQLGDKNWPIGIATAFTLFYHYSALENIIENLGLTLDKQDNSVDPSCLKLFRAHESLDGRAKKKGRCISDYEQVRKNYYQWCAKYTSMRLHPPTNAFTSNLLEWENHYGKKKQGGELSAKLRVSITPSDKQGLGDDGNDDFNMFMQEKFPSLFEKTEQRSDNPPPLTAGPVRLATLQNGETMELSDL